MKLIFCLLFVIYIKSQVPPVENGTNAIFKRHFCSSLSQWWSGSECVAFDSNCKTEQKYRHEFYGCLKCTEKYFARDGSCVEPGVGCSKWENQVGCIEIDGNLAHKYAIINGIATEINNCQEMDPLKGCTKCKEDPVNKYTNVGGICVSVGRCKDANYTVDGGCKECEEGYFVSNKVCVAKDEGVVDVDTVSGKAISCDGGVESINIGTENSKTYYLDETRKCKRCDAFCQICNNTKSDTFISNCKKCFDGYYLIPKLDKCLKLPPGCSERYTPYYESGSDLGCKTCSKGYFKTYFNVSNIKVFTCTPQQDTCVENNVESGCQKCADGYVSEETNVGDQHKVKVCNGAIEVLSFIVVALLVLLF